MEEKSNVYKTIAPALRGGWFVILCLVISVTIANRWLKYATPSYESTSKLKLAGSDEGVPHSNLFKDFDVFATNQKISGELELLKSPMMIEKALDSLDFNVEYYRIGQMTTREIYHESPIILRYKISNKEIYNKEIQVVIKNKTAALSYVAGGKTVKIVTELGQLFKTEHGSFILFENEELKKEKDTVHIEDTYKIIIHDKAYLIENTIGTNLDITSVDKDIPVLRITFKSPVAEKTAAFSNALARAYIRDYVDTKTMAAKLTLNFIDKQIKVVGDNLEVSENNIKEYRDVNDIINIRQETETDLRKIADMRVQLANIDANLSAVTNLEKYINKGGDEFLKLAPNFEAFNDLLSTEIVKKMQALEGEKKELLLKFKPNNERVTIIDSKLSDLINYLKESISNTKKSNEIKRAEIQKAMDIWKLTFKGLPAKEKSMADMERKFRLNEKIFNFLSDKRSEAAIAQAATISFHRILAYAEVPTKQTSPKPTLVRIMAGLLALLVSLGILYTIESVKDKIRDLSDIEKNSSKSIIPVPGKDQNNLEIWVHSITQLMIQQLAGEGKIVSIKVERRIRNKEYLFEYISQANQRLNQKYLIFDKYMANVDSKNWELIYDKISKCNQSSRIPLPEPNYWLSDPNGWEKKLKTIALKGFAIYVISDDPRKVPDQIILLQKADCLVNVIVQNSTTCAEVFKQEIMLADYKMPEIKHIVLNLESKSLVSRVLKRIKEIKKIIREK